MWMYGTMADDLYDVIMSAGNMFLTVWEQLNSFLDNQPRHAICLGAEFRNLVQADLRMSE